MFRLLLYRDILFRFCPSIPIPYRTPLQEIFAVLASLHAEFSEIVDQKGANVVSG
jgi:hypothetical protein